MREVLESTLTGLEIGPGSTFGGLTVFPMLGARAGDAGERGYRTLDEALAAETLRVTETGTQGSVPELSVVNDGDLPVLLLDGEELVGAKQNRVLNLTVLVPAGKTLVIPVSCVEQGRWSSVSELLSATPQVMYAQARAGKVAMVSDSLRRAGRAVSDQVGVWRQLAAKSRRLGVRSPSGEMGELFRSNVRALDEYVRAFEATDGQVGALFALVEDVIGLELFDHHDTLRRLLPKLVRSYALDALEVEVRVFRVPGREDAREFLERVAECEISNHEGPGLGVDLRLEGGGVAGGALVHDERVVHLCAFLDPGIAGEGDGFGEFGAARRGRMTRSGWRRNHRIA